MAVPRQPFRRVLPAAAGSPPQPRGAGRATRPTRPAAGQARTGHAFGPLLRRSHVLVAAAAGNGYLQTAIAPLQGLSRRSWFANLRDRRRHPRRRQHHSVLLHAISSGDTDTAVTASRRLNDYLVEFAYRTLRERTGLPRA